MPAVERYTRLHRDPVMCALLDQLTANLMVLNAKYTEGGDIPTRDLEEIVSQSTMLRDFVLTEIGEVA